MILWPITWHQFSYVPQSQGLAYASDVMIAKVRSEFVREAFWSDVLLCSMQAIDDFSPASSRNCRSASGLLAFAHACGNVIVRTLSAAFRPSGTRNAMLHR